MHRRFVGRLASTLAIALVAFQSPWPVRAEGVAGLVNTDVITYSQIRELAGEKEKAAANQLKGEELVNKIKEIRLASINELMDRALILQEFKRRGSHILEDLVDQRIATIIREKFGGDREAFLRNLTAQGYSLDRFRQLERDKIIVTEMRREVIAGKIKISETQISDYYRQYYASGKSLKEVDDEIEKTLIQNESKRLQEDWIKELRKGAYIKIY
jgi:peptidyl-prolyl cis-trans isomerase SurA